MEYIKKTGRFEQKVRLCLKQIRVPVSTATLKMGGKEASLKAKEGLDSVKLAYVYASSDYELAALLEGVQEELPDVSLIGNTSFSGVITPECYIHEDEGFVWGYGCI